MAAALPVLLLLLSVSSTAFTTTDVYYVTADDAAGQCPPHQICHNLSYYISQPDYYFTSDTTITFLEGEHCFDREDLVHVSNVHNLTLKGQGQWPVAGAEETVMQSTVIINCTRGRGGFYFDTSHDITIEGLTVDNCGRKYRAVFAFDNIKTIIFIKNSIQHMIGNGLYVLNCSNVIITNCSYYHSALCDISVLVNKSNIYSGGVYIAYYTQYSNTVLELSHSNMTKCCGVFGGGLSMHSAHRGQLKIYFKNLKFSYSKAAHGGGILARLYGSGNVTLVVSNCIFFNGTAKFGGGMSAYILGRDNVTLVVNNCIFFNGTAEFFGGGMGLIITIQSFNLIINNTDLLNNSGEAVSDISIQLYPSNTNHVQISMLNSNVSTKAYSYFGVYIHGCCATLQITNTSMRFINIRFVGFMILSNSDLNAIQMDSCQFIGSTGVPFVIYLYQVQAKIINCTFSNNTSDGDGRSVVLIYVTGNSNAVIHSCIISGNNMTGITLIEAVATFNGRNVIQNNRNTDGAGITLLTSSYISIEGKLLLYNNTAEKHGGAILVKQYPLLALAQKRRFLKYRTIFTSTPCTMKFENNSSSVIFSGNRAGKGGSDMYGAILMGCNSNEERGQYSQIPHLGHPNETSWYFDTPLIEHLHFSYTDRLSSMSSDPIMVCFCNTTTNLPDCSDRTHCSSYYVVIM